ncbi:Mitochondrial sodium/calcium exchanger protein [Geodia barretti]|nr:Mitochondrial sodium/calcium exchanger protein [Geodia barretti]
MAAGFIALYVFYVVVVIVGRIFYQKWKSVSKARSRGSKLSSVPEQQKAKGVNPSPFLLPSSPLSHAITSGDNMKSDAIKPLIEDETLELEKSKDDCEVAHRKLGTTFHHTGNRSRDNSTGSEAEVYQGGSLQVTTNDGASDANKLVPPRPSSRPRLSRPRLSHPHGKPLHAKKEMHKSLHGANGPLFPQFGALLAGRRAISPTPNQERGWKYAAAHGLGRSAWYDERPRSTTPRKLLNKTLTGALDVSEEVVAAVGLPHVPEILHEIQKVHPPRKSPLISSHRYHGHSGSEEGSRHSSILNEDEEEAEDETTQLILKKPKKLNPLMRFLLAFYPFGKDFRELGLIGKIYEILKYPCGFILTLTVPVIDSEAELHNWNKWLNVLHCITGPVTVALLTEIGFKKIGDVFPVWALILFLGVVAALLVACTSWSDRRPVYHCVFAWLGFAIAVVWIYAIANEIVNLLQAFGIVVKLSDGILGITLLAWGNSIGDAVANMTMARQGFPRMAIGACYGGPLLNILIGVGVSSLYKSIKRRNDGFKFTLYFTQVEFFAAAFLIVTLAVSLLVITFSRYRIFRPVAVCLILFYIVFLVVSVLAEAKVLHIEISGVLSDG